MSPAILFTCLNITDAILTHFVLVRKKRLCQEPVLVVSNTGAKDATGLLRGLFGEFLLADHSEFKRMHLPFGPLENQDASGTSAI